MKYPETLNSDVLGEMKREGPKTVINYVHYDYETCLDIDGFKNVSVRFVPYFLVPIHHQTESEFRAKLKVAERMYAERMYAELLQKRPGTLLNSFHEKIKKLAIEYGFDEANESEPELYQNWNLQDVILFDSGLRLIFFGNTVFPSLDLCLEYDREWNLEDLYFDG